MGNKKPKNTADIGCVKVFIITNNDLHYDLLLLSSARCIAISTGYAHNQFPFPCSNGYWNAAPIVHAIGAFYLVAIHNFSHQKLRHLSLLFIYHCLAFAAAVINTEQNNAFHPFFFRILLPMICSLVNKGEKYDAKDYRRPVNSRTLLPTNTPTMHSQNALVYALVISSGSRKNANTG